MSLRFNPRPKEPPAEALQERLGVAMGAAVDEHVDAMTGHHDTANTVIGKPLESDDPAAGIGVSADRIPDRLERSDRRGEEPEELLPAEAHLHAVADVHSAARDRRPDGEYLALRERSRRPLRPGHPVAVDKHDRAQRLGHALAPDQIEHRGSGRYVELEAVARARLGGEVRGERGEEFQRDRHAVPAAAR